MFATINHPTRGEFTMPGCPIQLEDSPVTLTSAPLLGEHNREVYAEYLGIEGAELDRLKEQGII